LIKNINYTEIFSELIKTKSSKLYNYTGNNYIILSEGIKCIIKHELIIQYCVND
jgi:hypothetical protein